jgi:hypothetical protein
VGNNFVETTSGVNAETVTDATTQIATTATKATHEEDRMGVLIMMMSLASDGFNGKDKRNNCWSNNYLPQEKESNDQ